MDAASDIATRGADWIGRLAKLGFVLVIFEAVIAANLVLGHYILPPATQAEVLHTFAGHEYATSQFPRFAEHAALSALHFVPGLLFAVLGPLQFVRGLRQRSPRLHRWCGRVFAFNALLLGASGLAIAFVFPYVPFAEAVPTVFYSVILFYATTAAVLHARRRDFVRHREWMVRVLGLGLGISTARIFFTLFLYTTTVPSSEFFSSIFWLGSGVNLVIAEIWINLTRVRTGVRQAASRRLAPRVGVAMPNPAPEAMLTAPEAMVTAPEAMVTER